ncbi:MAG: hypothetical protein OHK93_004718 [Ramalina farinacea]|uniref:Major facilitator superfamily (MFS) profile domain-containing protein n=1 Tax=Ramalina farinacea TaxID=258253 RepID=A0AA43QZ41_9LECA|nr:hypothetical protein [Ramalina farinacea]
MNNHKAAAPDLGIMTHWEESYPMDNRVASPNLATAVSSHVDAEDNRALPSPNASSAPLEPEKKPVNPMSNIPDGGFTAWMQCAGSFFIFFNGFGLINSFGIFQSYYELTLLRDESSSRISWIGSIQAFLLIFTGIFTGPLFDLGYCKSMICAGALLIVFGTMMTSLCTEYWQFILAQGLVVGIGCGLSFIPSIALTPTYFSKKKGLANGICLSGSSFGGILYPIIFHQLQPQIGFGWTVRVIGLIMLVTLIVPVLGMKMRVKPPKRRDFYDPSALREPPLLIFGVAGFFAYMTVYIPFFYAALYGIKVGVSVDWAIYLLVLLSLGSFFGRLIPGHLADRYGPMNILALASLTTTIVAYSWIAVVNKGGMIVFSVLYGFFSGALVSLPPTVVASLCPNMGVIGTRIGMFLFPTSIGLLIGNPIAGAILKSGWVDIQAFCGTIAAMTTILVTAARFAKTGLVIGVKA